MQNSKPIPAAAMIVAIANLVLFVPCLCTTGGGFAAKASGGLSGFQVPPQQQEFQNKVQAEIARELPNAKTVELISSVVTLSLSIGMIVAAIGLLTRQAWGRVLCILCSVLLIILAAAYAYYSLTVSLPVTDKITADVLKEQKVPIPQGLLENFTFGIVIVVAILETLYPALAIVLLMTAPVRRMYCSRQTAAADDSTDTIRRDDYDNR